MVLASEYIIQESMNFNYKKSDAYVIRKIHNQWLLVPFKRTRNDLKIFNFPYIGVLIWDTIECFNNSEEIKQFISNKLKVFNINNKEIESFIDMLLKYDLILGADQSNE